jgi:hypothetical protein
VGAESINEFAKAHDAIEKVGVLNGAFEKFAQAFQTSDQAELERQDALKDEVHGARQKLAELKENHAPQAEIEAARQELKEAKQALHEEKHDGDSELKKLKIEKRAIEFQLTNGDDLPEDARDILERELDIRKDAIREMRGGNSPLAEFTERLHLFSDGVEDVAGVIPGANAVIDKPLNIVNLAFDAATEVEGVVERLSLSPEEKAAWQAEKAELKESIAEAKEGVEKAKVEGTYEEYLAAREALRDARGDLREARQNLGRPGMEETTEGVGQAIAAVGNVAIELGAGEGSIDKAQETVSTAVFVGYQAGEMLESARGIVAPDASIGQRVGAANETLAHVAQVTEKLGGNATGLHEAVGLGGKIPALVDKVEGLVDAFGPQNEAEQKQRTEARYDVKEAQFYLERAERGGDPAAIEAAKEALSEAKEARRDAREHNEELDAAKQHRADARQALDQAKESGGDIAAAYEELAKAKAEVKEARGGSVVERVGEVVVRTADLTSAVGVDFGLGKEVQQAAAKVRTLVNIADRVEDVVGNLQENPAEKAQDHLLRQNLDQAKENLEKAQASGNEDAEKAAKQELRQAKKAVFQDQAFEVAVASTGFLGVVKEAIAGGGIGDAEGISKAISYGQMGLQFASGKLAPVKQ